MDHVDLFRSRTFHGIVIGTLVLVAIYEPARTVAPHVEYLLAIGLVVAWFLGTRYERELLIQAGVVDRDNAIQAERDHRPV